VFSKEVQQAVRDELERGFFARTAGNEGKARVCARRAAGVALREYLRLSGAYENVSGPGSAYDLLGAVQRIEKIPLSVKEAARKLLLTVNEDHNLPIQVDLLEEARGLVDELEKLL
jgi:hypothetical protein